MNRSGPHVGGQETSGHVRGSLELRLCPIMQTCLSLTMVPRGSRARRAVLLGSRPGSGLSDLWWTSAPGPSGPELRRETQGAWPGSAPSAGQGATTWDLIGCGPRQSLMCEGFLCVCSQRRKTVAARSSRSPASSPAPTPSSGHRLWPLPGVLHLAQLWVSVTGVLPNAAVPLVPYCPISSQLLKLT